MRPFNESEKAVIRKLVSLPPAECTILTQFFGSQYFTERKGRALIFQTSGQYAVFYLRPDVFDDEHQRRIETIKMFELISLLQYLKEQRYIFLYGSERTKAKSFHFVHDSFNRPQHNSGRMLLLNERGDYTSTPELIQNKDDEVIYKGVMFHSETYDLMKTTLTGMLYVSVELRNLVHDNFITKTDRLYLQQKKNTRTSLAIVLFFGITGITLGFLNLLSSTKNTEHSSLIKNTTSESKLEDTIQRQSDQIDTSSISETVKIPAKNFYGLDISRYNGDIVSEIDESDSITFMICKATEGISYTDSNFHSNWKTINKKNILKGAYHFFRIDDDPIEQAKYFWTALQEAGDSNFPPILDIEQGSLSINAEIDTIDIHRNVLEFLEYIRKHSNRTPIIYTDESFANVYLRDNAFSQYPLWLAEYTSSNHLHVPHAWIHKGILIWQKSDHYTINSTPTDYDVFYGQLWQLVK